MAKRKLPARKPAEPLYVRRQTIAFDLRLWRDIQRYAQRRAIKTSEAVRQLIRDGLRGI